MFLAINLERDARVVCKKAGPDGDFMSNPHQSLIQRLMDY
jgi:hypothetical protein